jgi:uncharacterized membrane protein HdeD (DUF308 family)
MKQLERHAWWVFFIFGILAIVTAPIMLSGNPPNPPSPQFTTGMALEQMKTKLPGLDLYISSMSTQLGNFMLALGVLLAGVAAFPYRKGERWSWFATWTVPSLLVIQLANSLRSGGHGWQEDAALIPVTLAALLVPYRRFFRPTGSSAHRSSTSARGLAGLRSRRPPSC